MTFVHREFCAFYHVDEMDRYFDSAEDTLIKEFMKLNFERETPEK